MPGKLNRVLQLTIGCFQAAHFRGCSLLAFDFQFREKRAPIMAHSGCTALLTARQKTDTHGQFSQERPTAYGEEQDITTTFLNFRCCMFW